MKNTEFGHIRNGQSPSTFESAIHQVYQSKQFTNQLLLQLEYSRPYIDKLKAH
jgi:hypothetical protein